jgi:predicted nucleic acid-binding protein
VAGIEVLVTLAEELSAAAPTVIVADDLQWADHASLVVWYQLAASIDQLRLLLIATCRPAPRRPEVHQAWRPWPARGAGPHLMPVEAASILRRAAQAGDISADVASLAHTDLLDLRVEFIPYQPYAARVWELRDNVTCYDGWYVAVAELLDAPLATLDGRLANSPGPRCQFLLPPAEA